MTTDLTLSPGETREVVFGLGQADSLAEVHRLIRDYTQSHRAEAALTEVQRQWDRFLNALHVTTPDPGVDLMLNRWLVYQVGLPRWAARVYRSGGAYVRDQLQDVRPWSARSGEARTRILRSARDNSRACQHWWHPPSGLAFARGSPTTLFPALVVHHFGDNGRHGLVK
jgi:cellobiose phosphorylase